MTCSSGGDVLGVGFAPAPQRLGGVRRRPPLCPHTIPVSPPSSELATATPRPNGSATPTATPAGGRHRRSFREGLACARPLRPRAISPRSRGTKASAQARARCAGVTAVRATPRSRSSGRAGWSLGECPTRVPRDQRWFPRMGAPPATCSKGIADAPSMRLGRGFVGACSEALLLSPANEHVVGRGRDDRCER